MSLDFSGLNNISSRTGKNDQRHLVKTEGITVPAPENNPIAAAQAIINHHNLNHEISKGCRLQILHDLERKENPYKLLLYAAEAIGRLDNQGDTFFSEVQNKIIEVWGRDISEDSPNT